MTTLKPAKTRVCGTCRVERGYGDCKVCQKLAVLRKMQDYLRVKKRPDGKIDLVGAGTEEAKGLQLRRLFTKQARNVPCPCGSGRKAKRCCMPKFQLKPGDIGDKPEAGDA